MLTMFMNRNHAAQTSWDKEVDNTVYGKRKKYSCCMITCITIGATLFFVIGLFQTVLVFAFARESSRGPVLVMGPVFMGIGAMMFMVVIEMCIAKHKKRKQVTNVAPEVDDVKLDEKEREMIEQELGLPNNKNTIVLRADQLPAMLTLNQDDLKRLGPDSKQMLFQPMKPMQPMMPPVDVSMMHVPMYYSGNPAAARPVPSSAVYQLPSNVLENAANTENGVTEQQDGNGDVCLYVTCEKPANMPGTSGTPPGNVQLGAMETSAEEAIVETEQASDDATNPATSPTPDPDAIPDEIIQMLDKVQEMYRNDTPAEGDNESQAADAQIPDETANANKEAAAEANEEKKPEE